MARDVWITGVGLTSSLGEGADAHWRALAGTDPPRPVFDRDLAPPFAVHPMVPLDFDAQIPRRSDQRQMESWQRVGTHSAGLALTDAGIAGDAGVLGRTHAIVAADGGERDIAVDGAILEGLTAAATPGPYLNERLANDLRPTLFLAQLPNLLAGNISIVHKVTGSSRTFMGEELAGVSAVEIGWRKIAAGQGEVFLVGGAYVAERKDAILNNALGGLLWDGEPLPVWARLDKGGGAILGSVGAFLVLEDAGHARARGRRPYARLAEVRSGRSRRRPGEVGAGFAAGFDDVVSVDGPPPAVLSGATGIAAASGEERQFLAGLIAAGRVATVRAGATMLGRASNAMFPALTALAALALARNGFFLPFEADDLERPLAASTGRIVVTTAGIWRGEGMGLVTAAA